MKESTHEVVPEFWTLITGRPITRASISAPLSEYKLSSLRCASPRLKESRTNDKFGSEASMSGRKMYTRSYCNVEKTTCNRVKQCLLLIQCNRANLEDRATAGEVKGSLPLAARILIRGQGGQGRSYDASRRLRPARHVKSGSCTGAEYRKYHVI